MISPPSTVSTRTRNGQGVRLACLFALACLQAAPLSQSAKSTEGVKQPLRYRLIVSEPSVCPKDGISLELELENTSNGKILIDPRALLHAVNISRSGGAVGATGDLGGKTTLDQLVSLEAGMSYRKTLPYPLQGNFFSAGIYSIHVTYGQFAELSPGVQDLYRGTVESNKVLFEIRNCE